jgi:Ca2+-binding EF-hand superfamily protein
MFSAMGLTKIGINEHISAEIFDMMDVDQSGSVSIAEFTAQFN